MSELTLFYASDVHGSERCFLKFVNAARFYGVRALVLGGDITGKVLVPIVRQGPEWRCEFLGRHERLSSEAEVAEMEKRIRMNGHYPYVCDADEFERLMADEPYRRQVFERVMRATVERWVQLAEERLKGSGVRCCIMPGNDDGFFVDEALDGSSVVVNHDGRAVWLDDRFQVVGCSWSNPTPWHSPREEPEEQLAQRLARAVATAEVPPERLILNFHVPPYKSGLDMAPALREDLSVALVGGQPQMAPVGSTAVRQQIEAVQPLVALHGHVHESRGTARLGRTLCVNPGSDYSGGVLKGCLLTLRPGKVVGYQLVEG